MECFSYKGGCDEHVLRHLKQELAWATDKGCRVINNNAVMPLRLKPFILCVLPEEGGHTLHAVFVNFQFPGKACLEYYPNI